MIIFPPLDCSFGEGGKIQGGEEHWRGAMQSRSKVQLSCVTRGLQTSVSSCISRG